MTSANNGNSPQQHDTRLFSYPLNMARNKAVVDSGSDHNQGALPHQQFFLGSINQASMMMHAASSSSPSLQGNFNMNYRESGGSYDMGEMDQAFLQFFEGQYQLQAMHELQQQQNSGVNMRPAHTLNIFPSQPMHVHPSATTSKASEAPSTSGSKRSSEPSIDLCNNLSRSEAAGPSKAAKHEGKKPRGPGPSSHKDGQGTPDAKTLRRLAQNREAARKSRLRKKAYIQQLEASRLKLIQMETDLQRVRGQGLCIGESSGMGSDQGFPASAGNVNSDAGVFNMEYGRWVEEYHRMMGELKKAVEERQPESKLRVGVERCITHFDQVVHLKAILARSDPFHLLSGMWCTPAERCFLWIAGSRPSHIIKIILGQIQPLTEQQVMGVYALLQSTQEAEEALSQGLEALHTTVTEAIISDSLLIPPSMNAYMGQMALAAAKLQTLEGFVRQADNLRQQTVHRLRHILTNRQVARSFLAIAEYFHRLRALSALWHARPRPE